MFRAAAKGNPLPFDTDGLVGGNEVFRDRETGSHWQQSALACISGPLKGEHLELYPFLLTTWQEWYRWHPNTLVLKPRPGYAERLAEKNKIINQGLRGGGAAPRGAFGHDSRLAPRETILGLDVAGTYKAFPLSTAYVSRTKGRTLKLKVADAAAKELIDVDTHSRCSAYGFCISGPLRGTQLERSIPEPEFWFAWSEFHPTLPGSGKY